MTALAGGKSIKTLRRPPGIACEKVQGFSNPHRTWRINRRRRMVDLSELVVAGGDRMATHITGVDTLVGLLRGPSLVRDG